MWNKKTPVMILQVQIQVKPECIDAFREAALVNARLSVQEPGNVRYEVHQQLDDPARFLLFEIYRSPEDHAAHRETPHYKAWRDAVAPMMAVPRVGTKFAGLFPAGLEG